LKSIFLQSNHAKLMLNHTCGHGEGAHMIIRRL
jgi:hypothetical protein